LADTEDVITIRSFEERDWPGIWRIMEPVFRAGETYSFSPDIPEQGARDIWVKTPAKTFVAEDDAGVLVGTYFIKPNQPGLGSHVCNCGYVVGEHAQGQGVASRMCEHSQREAIARGFRAMQYNFVVSTNEGAVRLWKKHGFAIAGTLPGAFRHAQFGYVDVFVMYKVLAT
jgi:L-amino acid N-acyltransferase YncA